MIKFSNEHTDVPYRHRFCRWTVWRVSPQMAAQSDVFTRGTFSSHFASVGNELGGCGIDE
jgi:hypothetical protein